MGPRKLWEEKNMQSTQHSMRFITYLEGPFNLASGRYTLNNAIRIERRYYNTFVTCDGFTCPSYGQPRAQETYLERSERAMRHKVQHMLQDIWL